MLSIETSCDETALSLIDAKTQMRADRTRTDADKNGITVTVLADKTLSQIGLHRTYGGVFPALAKREHNRNLIPLFDHILRVSNLYRCAASPYFSILQNTEIRKLLEREQELNRAFVDYIATIEKPPIDAVAVTVGPGLEPCLWTGVNFAQALSLVWDIPIVPVNHMEGHIFSSLLRRKEISNSPNYSNSPNEIQNPKSEILNAIRYTLYAPSFPALALLISGGHTELVLIRDYFKYEIIGQTRDDAVGEAFDKVARLLGLPYPGGPEISRLAEQQRELKAKSEKLKVEDIRLPRPMMHSNDFDFSFSGLKTAVLYFIKKLPMPLTMQIKAAIAKEFEDAVTEVLVTKTKRAIEQFGAKALLIGGGVIANTHIRRAFTDLANTYGRMYLLNGEFLHIPESQLTTDNALMIAVAGFLRFSLKNGLTKRARKKELVPNGNLRLDER